MIIKELLLGYARPVDSPVPPGLIGHTSLPAKAVRSREGARRSSSRRATPTLTLDFVLMKDLYPKQLEITQAVAAMLGEVGIKVNIKNLEIATAREQRTAGTYDLFFSGWAHMPHDPDWYFGQWFTKAGAEKLTRYNNPRSSSSSPRGACRIPRCARRSTRSSSASCGTRTPEIWPYYSVAIYGVSDRLRNFEARRDYYVLLSDVGIA